MSNLVLSVLTPTYNRARELQRLKDSLDNQTSLEFEWVIVDDGSEDDTENVVDGFEGALFPIRYLKKENGGKHTAINYACQYLQGNLTIIVDSDDWLTCDAVEKIICDWKKYSTNENICCLSYLKDMGHGSVFSFQGRELVSDHFSYRINKGVAFDCAEVTRTECIKEIQFPEYEGEHFVGEGSLWNILASRGYKTVYVNEVIYEGRYLEGGLSDSVRSLRISSPLGGMYNSKTFFHPRVRLMRRLKESILFSCYGFFAGKTAREILCESGLSALYLPTFLAGYFLKLFWNRKYLHSAE